MIAYTNVFFCLRLRCVVWFWNWLWFWVMWFWNWLWFWVVRFWNWFRFWDRVVRYVRLWHMWFVMRNVWNVRLVVWLSVCSEEVECWCSLGCVHVCMEGIIVNGVECCEWIMVSAVVNWLRMVVGWLRMVVGWLRMVVGWLRRVVGFWLWFWMLNLVEIERIEDSEGINSSV